MTQLLIKYGNIVPTTTTGHRVRYHLCLLLLVRLGGYIVNLEICQTFILTGSSGNWPLFCSFRSSACATWSCPVPLPPSRFSSTAQNQGWPDSRYSSSFTYQLKYRWVTYHFKNTYSPITLANISSINVVSIFRCSSLPSNPVNVRRVNSLALVCSLSSHRHSYIGLIFSSRFIDS